MFSYNSTATLPCRGCGQGFKSEQEILLYRERRWHRACFRCQTCKKGFEDLGGRLPNAVKDLPYCSNCFAAANTTLCGACKQPITDGRILTVPGIHHKFHPNCFKCDLCGAILQQQFRKRGAKIICPGKCGGASAAEEKATPPNDGADAPEETPLSGAGVAAALRAAKAGEDSGVGSSNDDLAPPQSNDAKCDPAGDSVQCPNCHEARDNSSAKFCGSCGHKF